MLKVRVFLVLSVGVFALAGCATQVENAASANFDPVYPTFGSEDMGMPSGTIYSARKTGLFAADRRANKVGDILTVAFTESFQATKSQNAAASQTSGYDTQLPTILPFSSLSPKLTGSSSDSFAGAGSAAQSNSLTGQVSVHVVRILPGGNLEILGQKKLTLNNGDEYIRVHGIVRPEDISSGNVVLSDRIANAEITYIGAGDTADTARRGWFSRLVSTVKPL